MAEVHGQHQVLDGGERGQQLEELEDNADVAPAPFGQFPLAELVDCGVPHQHIARGRPVDAGDHVDQGRLTATRLADHGHELAAVDLQVHVLERCEITRGAAIGLHHLMQLDEMAVAVLIRCVHCCSCRFLAKGLQRSVGCWMHAPLTWDARNQALARWKPVQLSQSIRLLWALATRLPATQPPSTATTTWGSTQISKLHCQARSPIMANAARTPVARAVD